MLLSESEKEMGASILKPEKSLPTKETDRARSSTNSCAQSSRPAIPISLPELLNEPKILHGEFTQVGKHRCQIWGRQTIPRCQCGCVLLDRSRRDPTPATATVVIRTGKRQSWVCSIKCAALYRAAQDECVTSPGMIGSHRSCTAARGLEGPPKVRERKQRHAVAVSLRHHLVTKSAGGLAELR